MSVTPIDALARRLARLLPPAGAREVGEDLLANHPRRLACRACATSIWSPAEEFDVQRAVLLRTREMVEALEKRVGELEAPFGQREKPPN